MDYQNSINYCLYARKSSESDEVQKEIYTDKEYNFGKVQFPFKGIFSCYGCGSGICGEYKKRKLKYGGFRDHIYYHCTRSRNPKCKEMYLTERALIREIISKVNKLSDEKIIIPAALKSIFSQYKKIIVEAKYLSEYGFDGEPTAKDYINYIVRQGTPEARKKLLLHLPIPKKIHNRMLIY